MNDYYIASDMNGHYAIVHGIEWKNHKYIKKIGEGKTALYFYNLKELQSYLSNVRNRMQKTGESAVVAGGKVAQTFAQKGSTALSTAKTTGNRVYGVAKNSVTNAVEVVKAEGQRVTAPKATTPAQTTRLAPENQSTESVLETAKKTAGKVMGGIRRAADIKDAAVKKLTTAAEKAVGQLRTRAKDIVEKLPQSSKSKSDTSADTTAPAVSNEAAPADAETETKASRPTGHQKNVTGSAKEGWSKRRPLPGSENKPNPAQDLQNYANELIDPDIQISSDKTAKEQIQEYTAAVDKKLEQLMTEDPAASDQYMKEQLFVIGAMSSAQYYEAKQNYERGTVELAKFAKEADKARAEHEKAVADFKANRSKMTKEERQAAKEQLNWKQDMLKASVQNYNQQQELVLSYYDDMNFYKEVIDTCTSGIEMLQPQTPSEPLETYVEPAPHVAPVPSAPLQIDPRTKR